MKPFRKHSVLKITGLSLLALVIIVFGGSRYLSCHYRKMIQTKLPAMAAKATDSLYLVTAGNFKVNVFGRSISILNLHIRPNSAVLARRRQQKKLPPVLLDVTIPEIEIAGLKLGNLSAEKEIICRNTDIYHPRIIITLTDTADRDHTLNPKTHSALERIFVNTLIIHDPDIRFLMSEAQDATALKAKGGTISLSEWDFHPGAKPDTTRFFFAKQANIQLCSIAYRKPGMLYVFGVDTVHFISDAHTAKMSGMYVKPSVSKPAFYREVKMQKEIYQGTFPLVEITGFQWETLLQNHGFSASAVALTSPDLDIYLSRLYAPNLQDKAGNYPHQLLKKLTFPVDVPVVNVFRGSFHYTEVSEKTRRAGTLDFSSITGRITNVSNRQEHMGKGEHCLIKLTGKFMRKSNMGAIFDFPLDETQGEFRAQGRLLELNANQVSETAKALAMAEIKSLQLHQLDFDIYGNDYSSDGKITILYNDLIVKIKKIDKETLQLYNRGFVSFLANGLLLYNDNPMSGEPVRLASTHLVRDTTKSFFNLIWRNLFEAGIQTAIRQEGITDLVKKRKANKGKQKLHFFRQLFPKRNKMKRERRLFKQASGPSHI